MDPRIRRIKKEIADIQNDKTSGLTVEMVDGEDQIAIKRVSACMLIDLRKKRVHDASHWYLSGARGLAIRGWSFSGGESVSSSAFLGGATKSTEPLATLVCLNTGHRRRRGLPFPTSKDALHHQSLPPKHQQRKRRHLPRHPDPKGLEPRLDTSIDARLAAKPALLPRTKRPARCDGGEPLQGGQKGI